MLGFEKFVMKLNDFGEEWIIVFKLSQLVSGGSSGVLPDILACFVIAH